MSMKVLRLSGVEGVISTTTVSVLTFSLLSPASFFFDFGVQLI